MNVFRKPTPAVVPKPVGPCVVSVDLRQGEALEVRVLSATGREIAARRILASNGGH